MITLEEIIEVEGNCFKIDDFKCSLCELNELCRPGDDYEDTLKKAEKLLEEHNFYEEFENYETNQTS